MNSTNEILERGMECLARELGEVEAEIFISAVNREQIDYTKWRSVLFNGMSADEFNAEAVKFAKEHPFTGKKAEIL